MSRLDRLCLALTGQDALVVYHQLQAIVCNLHSWLLLMLGWRTASHCLAPSHQVLPSTSDGAANAANATAVLVLSPGGLERLSLEPLLDNVATVGYNVTSCTRVPGCNSLAVVEPDAPLPDRMAIVRISAASVNYADVTIRWGLCKHAAAGTQDSHCSLVALTGL